MAKNPEMRIQSLDQEDPLEKGMATHSSILTWKTPWTEESGGLHIVCGVAVHVLYIKNVKFIRQEHV